MKVRAVIAFNALLEVATNLSFISFGMILLLLPSVTFLAEEAIGAPVFIVYYEFCCFPVRARMGFILRDIRFSSIILPIMRVNTESLIMLSQIERAPDSLEIKHVKIIIILQIVNQLYHNIVLKMSK